MNFRGLPRPFWVLFAGTLVNRLGGFVLVFLAIYLTEIRGLSAGQAGLIISVYGLGAVTGGPFGGALSDRIGRRPTLVVSLIAGGVMMLALGLVTRFAAIAAVAFFTGLFYEMYRPVVSATVADVVSPDDRPRAYSLLYWAVNLGASVAPLLGGLIAARSYRVLFAADAATTVAYGVILWIALPETRPSAARDQSASSPMRVILADRIFLAVCVLTLVFCCVFYQSFIGLPIDVRAHGVSAAGFGALIALNGIIIVLIQPFAGGLIQHHSRLNILTVSSLLMGIGLGMNGWIGSLTGYALAVVVWTFGEILFSPAALALVADLAPAHLRGAYQGAFAISFTGAFAIAPALGGYVLAHAGARTLWIGCLATGACVGAGFWLLKRGMDRH